MMRALAKHSPLRWLRFRCGNFRLWNDERGVSAVEFALILPVMMVLYLGGVEVSKGISVNRKVTLAARTLSDLVAQVAKVTAADISNVLSAGEAVSWPFNDGNLKLRVSNVEVDALGVAKIKWSRARNWTPRADNDVLTGVDDVPAGVKVPGKVTYLIWSEVEYFYKPAVGGGVYAIIGENGIKLWDEIYMRPRLSETVTCDAC